MVGYPIIDKVLYIPGGAGYLPSTVSLQDLQTAHCNITNYRPNCPSVAMKWTQNTFKAGAMKNSLAPAPPPHVHQNPSTGKGHIIFTVPAQSLQTLLTRRNSIPLLLDILFLTFSYAHINATTTRANETCMPQWPEGGGRASKTCEKKRLCEPVCVRGTSSLQLTSQRPWASRQFAWTPLSHNCLQGTNISRLWTRKIIFDVYIYIEVYKYCFFGGSVSSQEGNLMSSRLALSSSEPSRFAIVCQDIGIPNVWLEMNYSRIPLNPLWCKQKDKNNILQNSLFLYTWSFLIGNLQKNRLSSVYWKFFYVWWRSWMKIWLCNRRLPTTCLSGSKGNWWPVPTRGQKIPLLWGATSLLNIQARPFFSRACPVSRNGSWKIRCFLTKIKLTSFTDFNKKTIEKKLREEKNKK